ncbi:MAG: hypothetical protein JXB10_05990 [Pirellulales bacterium]|nr:hypothetical protein [Pirellulales bacterium]
MGILGFRRRGGGSFRFGNPRKKPRRDPFSLKLRFEPLEDRRLLSTIYSANFDVNPGWMTSGEWAFGHPTGGGGTYGYPDPSNGYTGSNVYGVDLLGDYDIVGGSFYLTTTAINCTGYSDVSLSFRRWLNTDYQPFVAATIEVSNNGTIWNSIYANPSDTEVADYYWHFMQYDISAYADDQTTVYVRWGYEVFYTNSYPYSGWNIDDVLLSGILTAPTPGITVTPTSGLTTTEAGGTAAFTIVLDTLPAADVNIALSSTNTDEGTVSPESVTFLTSNWDAPQTVAITGVDDAQVDGGAAYTVVTAAASSADPDYNGLNPEDVSVTNLDDDLPTLTLTVAAPSISEAAGPGATTATVTRNWGIANPLTVYLSSSDTTEAVVPDSVTIPGNEASATFDIDAVDDAAMDGTQTVTITTDAHFGGESVGLDASFGTGGLATTSLEMNYQPPHNALAIQPDGKIVAASESDLDYAWRVTRLNSDGTVDAGFGTNGVVEATFLIPHPVPHKIIIQPDGKILVGGEFISGTNNIALARYNTDGSLDGSFGTGGIANFPSVTYQWIEDMALRTDGKILLALGINGTVYCRVARLNSNGSLDASFGSGGIKTFSGVSVSARAITLMDDGRFLLAGNYTSNSKILRAYADGTLDTTFGTGGVQTVNFGSDYTRIYDLAVDSVGRIVAGGSAYESDNNTSNFAVARLYPNGNFDASFDIDGMAITDFSTGLDDYAYSMAVQNDDKIVLLGSTETSDNVQQVALVRYNVDGSLDADFDGDGRLQVSVISHAAQQATNCELQADGKLVVLAGWGSDWRIARFTMGSTPIEASDTLEVTDNDVPTLTLTIAAPSVSEAAGPGATTATVTRDPVSADPLVVYLSSSDTSEAEVPASVTIPGNQASTTFAIDAVDDDLVDGIQVVTITASNEPGGASIELDSSFGSGGSVATTLYTNYAVPHNDIAVQPDGKIVAACGISGNNYAWRVIRLNSDGSMDPSFGTNGVVDTTFPSQKPLPNKILIQPDGKIVVGGSLNTTVSALARYNADGSLDLAFGNGGIANFYSNQWIVDMALRPDGKILLALQQNGPLYLKVACLDNYGALDPSFGDSGGFHYYLDVNAYSCAIASMPDGRFLLAGRGTSDWSIIRAYGNGSLDTTFGTNGVQTVNFDSAYQPESILVDHAGRIVLNSTMAIATSLADFAVARLTPNGILDTSFSDDGRAMTDFGLELADFSYSMVIQSDDKIVLAGNTKTSESTRQVGLVRFNVDGSLDSSFDGDGRFHVALTSSNLQTSVCSALQSDGKLVLLAGYMDDWRVARFKMQVTCSATIDVTDNDVPEHAVRTWDGGGTDSNWTTAANWVGNAAPQPGDDLIFPSDAAKLTSVNNYPAGTVFGKIIIGGSGYQIEGEVASSDNVHVRDGASLTATSITAGTLTIGGVETCTWDGGGADNQWSTAENWADGSAPLPGDNLVFPAEAEELECVNDFPAGTVFGEVVVEGGDYSFQNSGLNAESVRVQDDVSLTVASIVAGTLMIGDGEESRGESRGSGVESRGSKVEDDSSGLVVGRGSSVGQESPLVVGCRSSVEKDSPLVVGRESLVEMDPTRFPGTAEEGQRPDRSSSPGQRPGEGGFIEQASSAQRVNDSLNDWPVGPIEDCVLSDFPGRRPGLGESCPFGAGGITSESIVAPVFRVFRQEKVGQVDNLSHAPPAVPAFYAMYASAEDSLHRTSRFPTFNDSRSRVAYETSRIHWNWLDDLSESRRKKRDAPGEQSVFGAVDALFGMI